MDRAPGVPEIPDLVFEELLVNALIHRDYLVSAPWKHGRRSISMMTGTGASSPPWYPERRSKALSRRIEKIHGRPHAAQGFDSTPGEGLFRGWIKARQAANDDPNETAKALLAWVD